MNITNKIKKASALRDKEAYIQSANGKFGFKVSGKGTYIWTSEEAESLKTPWKAENNYSSRCVKREVKSYELKVSGGNNFWVITELDGSVILIDTIEYTTSYYYRARTAKAKVGDWKVPHKCYGYWTEYCDKVKAWEEKDVEEMEAKGLKDSYYRWVTDRNALLDETFN